jgi:Tol biopolymer transport system component
LLKRFDENTLSIQDLSGFADNQSDSRVSAPDQAIILAENLYEQNLYILEFSDGSIRNVTSSAPSASSSATSLKSYSPDRNALVVVRQDGVKQRFELFIQTKKNNKFKTIWTLPPNMTIIPELPLWSPDSRMLAFYARSYQGVSGFYSLYIYSVERKEMLLIQEQVYSTLPSNNLTMGSFVPEWSKDSKSLIFQYQNYGHTDSSIFKYEPATGKKKTLTVSNGHNLNPSWSPSGRSILFLSNRESAKDQVYTMDSNGEKLKQLSSSEGYTEWANWYKAE